MAQGEGEKKKIYLVKFFKIEQARALKGSLWDVLCTCNIESRFVFSRTNWYVLFEEKMKY